jgi:hypothetical protein
MAYPRLSWVSRAMLVAVTAALITGVGGAVATADDTTDAARTVTTYEVFRETIKPWDSIKIPSRSCPVGYLHNRNYSPGRMVPAGVEVVEPGGVGVTIAPGTEDGPVWVENGRLVQPINGWDANEAYSGATNWDPITSREVVIKIHCTSDTDYAVVEDLGPSPL